MVDCQPTLILDSREPTPHPWTRHLSLETVRGTLPTGDISLVGCSGWICVERKSLNDLIACLCSGRERFTKELQRAQRIREFYVVCEGSYGDIARGSYHSNMNPLAAWESIVALQSRYGIPFLMAGSVQLAAKLTESILLRWFKEHSKAVEAATKGSGSHSKTHLTRIAQGY